jgi:hypothetical protein
MAIPLALSQTFCGRRVSRDDFPFYSVESAAGQICTTRKPAAISVGSSWSPD